ncbi:MAG: hypothetical protein ACRDRG_15740 [Pseudonocardiaceae bacterium]
MAGNKIDDETGTGRRRCRDAWFQTPMPAAMVSLAALPLSVPAATRNDRPRVTPSPTERTRRLASVRPPGGARGVRVRLGHRVASLLVAVLVFLAALVVQWAALALAPATAVASPTWGPPTSPTSTTTR